MFSRWGSESLQQVFPNCPELVLGKMFQQAAQNHMRKKIHGFLQSILYVFYMY